MRVYMACSMDGHIAGPEHELDWLHRDYSAPGDLPPAEDALRFEPFLAQIGAMLMGRSTYETVEKMGVWPYGDIPVLVATRRQLSPKQPSVRAMRGTISELIDAAKREAGEKDVYLDGGDLVQQALNAHLVDELTLTYIPILLGKGIRLFDRLDGSTVLQVVAHRTFDQGALQVTLRPRPQVGA